MKFLAVFFMVIVIGVSIFAAPAINDEINLTERKCVPDRSYYDGCNNCWCTTNGITLCTLKACFQQLPNGTILNIGNDPAPEDFWQK